MNETDTRNQSKSGSAATVGNYNTERRRGSERLEKVQSWKYFSVKKAKFRLSSWMGWEGKENYLLCLCLSLCLLSLCLRAVNMFLSSV